MAKVKNPMFFREEESGDLGDVKFIKANLKDGFTHIVKVRKSKPRKKKVLAVGDDGKRFKNS